MINYYGPYEESNKPHEAIEKYLQAKNLTASLPCWEEYVTDPEEEPDQSKWLTRIYYFLEMNKTAIKQFSHASVVFPVEDVEASAHFYRDKLGFNITFTWDTPVSYAVVNRDDAVGIHLVKKQGSFHPSSEHCALFIFVHNVNKVYKEYVEKRVPIHQEIGDRAYGMRDFDIRDPNGFILSIGTGLERLRSQ